MVDHGRRGPTAYEQFIDKLRDHGSTVNETGTDRAVAQCPAHPDARPSLSISSRDDDKGIVINCHAGCDYTAVLDALGLTPIDLYDDKRMRSIWGPQQTYVYDDGRLVYRKRDKTFPQGGNLKGRTLYHASLLAGASVVYVVEGEKDVQTLEAIGSTATCSAMGAGKAHLADWSPLAGKYVTIIADNDKPGFAHANDIAELLKGVAATVTIFKAAVGKDVSDHIAAGRALSELVAVTPSPQQPKAKATKPPPPQPKLWKATDLDPVAQQRFLARGRIPRGAVTILCGDEGIGKSLFWVLIVVSVTTGKPFPEFGIPARNPERVILVITEDDWQTAVLPRLTIAGADLDMIEVICEEKDGSGSPIFPTDMDLITSANPAMVVVDAWLDTVPSDMSVKDTQQSRLALHPWRDAATKTDAAVMLLTHANRIATANMRDKYGATAALRQKARMTLYALADPEDGTLIIGPDKANSAAGGTKASLFRIVGQQHFTPTDDSDGTVPVLQYAGCSGKSIKDHLAEIFENEKRSKQKLNEVDRWLVDFLKHGAMLSTDLYDAALVYGYSADQVKRARAKVGRTFKGTGTDDSWYSELHPQYHVQQTIGEFFAKK